MGSSLSRASPSLEGGSGRSPAALCRRPGRRLVLFMLFYPVYAVYAISSLDTRLPLRPHPKATIVGTYQGVAGLAPRLFTLEEETGSQFMLFMQLARSTLDDP